METTFIKAVWTEQTGGGIMVDYLRLYTGELIGINDECVVNYGDVKNTYDTENYYGEFYLKKHYPKPELDMDGWFYYQAEHSNRHGIDTVTFRSKKKYEDLPDVERLAEELGIDFDPEDNEELEVYAVGIQQI